MKTFTIIRNAIVMAIVSVTILSVIGVVYAGSMQDVYVQAGAPDTNPGTQAQPVGSIEKALTLVKNANGRIHVGPGSFIVGNWIEGVSIAKKKNLVITGCGIDGNAGGTVFKADDPDYGTAFSLKSSSVEFNNIHFNHYEDVFIIDDSDVSLTVSNCKVTNEDNGNFMISGIGLLQGNGIEIKNCILQGYMHYLFAGASPYAYVKITNNVLLGCYIGIWCSRLGSFEVVNNIFYKNMEIMTDNSIKNTPKNKRYFNYNCIYNIYETPKYPKDWTRGEENCNITAAPKFVNADLSADADVHLAAGSPCIDKGHPNSMYNDPDGSRSDIGAYGGPGASVPDTVGPTITNQTVGSIPKNTFELIFKAQITDAQSGLNGSSVKLTVKPSKAYKMTCTKKEPNIYSKKVTYKTAPKTKVYYRIEAQDNSGNVTYFPSQTAWAEVSIQ